MVVAIEILFLPLSIHISFVLLPHLIIHSVRVYGMRYEKPFWVSFSFLPKGGGGGGGGGNKTMWNIGGGGGQSKEYWGGGGHMDSVNSLPEKFLNLNPCNLVESGTVHLT